MSPVSLGKGRCAGVGWGGGVSLASFGATSSVLITKLKFESCLLC